MVKPALLGIIAIAATLFGAGPEWRSRIDLKPLLDDPSALHRLRIAYMYDDKPGQVFYLYGDGHLILQQLPTRRGVWADLVPTCTARVSEDIIKDLIRLLIEKNFFDLPEKRFLFLYASAASEEDLHLHTIIIEAEEGRSSRSFGTGTFGKETQSIPPEFAEIEAAIQRIQNDAFPPSKTCRVAPPLKF